MELVRHRVFSFAQESTRYCNYSKDKFGNELTFIIPSWINDLSTGYYATLTKEAEILEIRYSKKSIDSEKDFDKARILECNEKNYLFVGNCKDSEYNYLNLIYNGCTPQEARQVLPNALKTEINMCGFVSDWKHFFALRDDKAAHPDMINLAKPLHEEFIARGFIK